MNSAIAGQIGGRAISSLRTPAQVKAQVAQSAKRQKIRSKVIATETIRKVPKEEVAKETARQQRVITKEQFEINKQKTKVGASVGAELKWEVKQLTHENIFNKRSHF